MGRFHEVHELEMTQMQNETKTTTTAPRPAKPKITKIAGSSLVPPVDQTASPTTLVQHWYWVGVFPPCPRGSIDLCGISFPKVTEQVRVGTGGKTQRTPRIGALAKLSEEKIRAMRERLPRTVIRFTGGDPVDEPSGAGEDITSAEKRPRRGQIITIPTPEQLAAAKKQGRPTRPYVAHPNDIPAARFMFAQLCENQERPERASYYPEALDVTGLEWPGDLTD